MKVTGKVEEQEAQDDKELEPAEASEFRAFAARMNYMAQNCPDMQFATKEACRKMAKPTFGSWAKAKWLAKYILEREAAVFEFKWQYDEPGLVVTTDSEWVGCRRTRRSSTGEVLMREEHCLMTWSGTQGHIALSWAEAEYYAMFDGVVRALGVQAICLEIGLAGIESPIELGIDSSAAKIASRRGLGKARHVQTRLLWLHQAVAEKRVPVRKVRWSENPADLLTKFLGQESVKQIGRQLGIELLWRPAAQGLGPTGGVGENPHPKAGETRCAL